MKNIIVPNFNTFFTWLKKYYVFYSKLNEYLFYVWTLLLCNIIFLHFEKSFESICELIFFIQNTLVIHVILKIQPIISC